MCFNVRKPAPGRGIKVIRKQNVPGGGVLITVSPQRVKGGQSHDQPSLPIFFRDSCGSVLPCFYATRKAHPVLVFLAVRFISYWCGFMGFYSSSGLTLICSSGICLILHELLWIMVHVVWLQHQGLGAQGRLQFDAADPSLQC